MPELEPIVARGRLTDLVLEAEGEQVKASEPEWGDATIGEPDLPGSAEIAARAEQHDHVTIGVAADEIGRLRAPVDRAVLRTKEGRQVMALKIEKVVPDFGVVVGIPLAH